MGEYINTYHLDSHDKNIYPMKRHEFYAEQHQVVIDTGGPNKSVDTVSIFLFNLEGELYVQKRSSDKAHNPSLLDKTIGGHVNVGDTPDHTVILETVQELQVPSLVINHNDDYMKNFSTLKNYLHTIALIKHIDSAIEIFDRTLIDGTMTKHANRYHFYLGVYAGSTKTVDKEAKGVLRYDLSELYNEVEKFPELFTHDIKFLLYYYRQQINKFVGEIAEL